MTNVYSTYKCNINIMVLTFGLPLFIRVLIPAVYKNTINPKLHVFNNCFDDEFSTRKWTMEAYCDCISGAL